MISVIVPVYNTEKQLERCISSICRQTYQDLEIIVIDDGSTDSSGILCDSLARRDSRIKVFHQENQGLSAARNNGMEIAGGEYIAFVDSDDWISPVMLETLHSALIREHADIAECGFSAFFRDHTQHFTGFSGNNTVADRYEAIIGLTLWETFYSVVWNKLYKKECTRDITFPVGRVHEDEFTTWKFIRNADRIVSVDASFYYYDRTRNDSIIARLTDNSLDKVDALQELCCYAWSKSIPSLMLAANNEYCRSSLEIISFLWRGNHTTERFWEYISRIRGAYKHIRNCQYPLSQVYIDCLSVLSEDTSGAMIEKTVCEWERVRSRIHHG